MHGAVNGAAMLHERLRLVISFAVSCALAGCQSAPPEHTQGPGATDGVPDGAVLTTVSPDYVCAGTELVGLRVDISPSGATSGRIVDPKAPAVALDDRTFNLIWPRGYTIGRVSGGFVVLDAAGIRVVSQSGDVLQRPQVCVDGLKLIVVVPSTPSLPAGR